MRPPLTLSEREKELQALLTTTVGRTQLRDLKGKYEEEGGRLVPAGTSVITYILVHEREKGIIAG